MDGDDVDGDDDDDDDDDDDVGDEHNEDFGKGDDRVSHRQGCCCIKKEVDSECQMLGVI